MWRIMQNIVYFCEFSCPKPDSMSKSGKFDIDINSENNRIMFCPYFHWAVNSTIILFHLIYFLLSSSASSILLEKL